MCTCTNVGILECAGFKALISKDFTAFGHMFHHRSGLVDPQEMAPIFLQFLDAVWQIWRQMPWEFEFTDSMLVLLAYAVNSRFTDDFVFDCEKSRIEYTDLLLNVVSTTHCVSCREKRMTRPGTPEVGQHTPPVLPLPVAHVPPRCDTPGSEGSHIPTSSSYDDLNATWRSTGGPEMINDECMECINRVKAARRSVWTYVSHNYETYLNPLFNPSTAATTTDESSAAEGSEVPAYLYAVSARRTYLNASPLHDGGRFVSAAGAEEGTSVYETDFGEDEDEEEEVTADSSAEEARTGEKTRRSSEVERIKKIFGSSGTKLGASSSDLESDLAAPRQLFVLDLPTPGGSVSASKLHWDAHTAPAGSTSSAGMAASLGCKREGKSTGTAHRPSVLISPSFDIQSLAVWEGVHFSGIPLSHTYSASSSSFSRGLEALYREEKQRGEDLEDKVRQQEAAMRVMQEELREAKQRVLQLQADVSAAAARSKSGGSSRDGDSDGEDYVVFGESEKKLFTCVEDEDGEQCRIISTGSLIENYMKS
jgi:hypothetical protein